MSKSKKLNIALAKTDALSHSFLNMLNDFTRFFHKSQGAFIGEKRTYQPKPDTIDEPNKRGNVLVQTTVNEKLDWFINNAADYIKSLFDQEKTNSSGNATAELVVGGKSWGIFTSLELLRLKSIVSNATLTQMLSFIPVRSDSEEWDPTDDDMYGDRKIMETPLVKGVNITTTKEDYILKDPNVSKDSPNYNAVVAQRTTTMELGDYTYQRFSGQWSQRERANTLARKNELLVAVIAALKVCNEAEIVESTLTANQIFGYIFGK